MRSIRALAVPKPTGDDWKSMELSGNCQIIKAAIARLAVLNQPVIEEIDE